MTKPVATSPADTEAIATAPKDVADWNNGRPFTIGQTTYATKFWNGVTYRNANPVDDAKGPSENWIKLTPAQQKRAMQESYDAAAAAKAAPTKAPAKKAASAKAPATPTTAVKLPAGYEVRWPHRSFDLAKKTDKSVDGPAWLVVCNEHGTTTEAANASEGDVLGGAKGRPAWCPACKSAAGKPAPAAKAPAKTASTPTKATAKPRTAKAAK